MKQIKNKQVIESDLKFHQIVTQSLILAFIYIHIPLNVKNTSHSLYRELKVIQ